MEEQKEEKDWQDILLDKIENLEKEIFKNKTIEKDTEKNEKADIDVLKADNEKKENEIIKLKEKMKKRGLI